jgi:UPF0755 protein
MLSLMVNDFQVSRPRRSGKKIVGLFAFALMALAAGFLVYAYMKIHRAGSTTSAPVTFSVPKGATTREVAAGLEGKNLIDSTFIFVGYAMLEGANGKIQAGDYALDRKMSMNEILDNLVNGKVTRSLKRVTIVEGATNAQIKKSLVDAGLVTSGQFDDAVNVDHEFKFNPDAREVEYEGYLFPDTYQFDVTWDSNQIIQRMLRNFESKVTDQMVEDAKKRNLSMAEIIVLASIIEREVGRSSSVQITEAVSKVMQEEREKVSSVFYNRLEIDMPLQSDATVNYVTGKNDRQALFDDLKVDSPYNTYKHTGLPPGPISNPGIDSIWAAIYPADTNYLYFLSDISGTAYFARTIEEHNSNRAKYLD